MQTAILRRQAALSGSAHRSARAAASPQLHRPAARSQCACRAAPPDAAPAEPPAPAPAATPVPKTTGELAKEALMQIVVSDKATTAKDVLGEGTLASLKQALGEERASTFIGALDGLLANRRMATFLFALFDIALIWVLIKGFRSTVLHE
ncbi:hypothetical protein TSOC_006066 [Tetrabaena socialis]|uniref:Uncharacterized protein n=1 Tax=Tetrabaena socialis TaxID=47790 RepID=A0A2J8A4Q4_9CHLO|nr:hypothetical protein TSOC_006066 [Tetrabaena socialis]|eukprot:PNH07483.1 hypothetical protein TSOC_006066 [Tetrabaena socialis]